MRFRITDLHMYMGTTGDRGLEKMSLASEGGKIGSLRDEFSIYVPWPLWV